MPTNLPPNSHPVGPAKSAQPHPARRPAAPPRRGYLHFAPPFLHFLCSPRVSHDDIYEVSTTTRLTDLPYFLFFVYRTTALKFSMSLPDIQRTLVAGNGAMPRRHQYCRRRRLLCGGSAYTQRTRCHLLISSRCPPRHPFPLNLHQRKSPTRQFVSCMGRLAATLARGKLRYSRPRLDSCS